MKPKITPKTPRRGERKIIKPQEQTQFRVIPSEVYDYQCQKHFSKNAFNHAETIRPRFRFENHIARLRDNRKIVLATASPRAKKLKYFQERSHLAVTDLY
jgi:hypothetical protein